MKPGLRTFLSASLALLALVSCASTAGSKARAEPDSSRLAADVAWLADDAREGRRAGTNGAANAGEWLAQRFGQLGLEPAGENGWTQAFEVPLPPVDGGASRVEVAGGSSASGAGLVAPLFCSEGGERTGPLAWCGYGVASEERGWDDYRSARLIGSLNGAVALVVRGAPPPDPAGPAADWGGADSLFTKVMLAKSLGAAAVLIAQHPARAGEPLPAFDDSRSARAGIPALHVSAELARALEPAYDELVKRLDGPEHGPQAFRAQTAPDVSVRADVRRSKGTAYNVLARLRGERSERCLVIGAHYDHLGRGGEGSLAPGASGEVHNGADDNASGTAAVLEIARILAQGEKPACDVVFALWSGEELGLLGSQHWTLHPTVPIEQVAANLNFDMVGRAQSGKLAVIGAGTSPPLARWVEEAAAETGVAAAVHRSGQGVGGSDHQTFLKQEIPALHFFTGLHEDYHRPSDDVERFEAEGARGVVALSLALTRRMAEAAAREELEFVAVREDPSQSAVRQGGRWSVRLGSMPDYAFEGKGVLLAGVGPESPAEKAGLQKGDLLERLGEVRIEGLADLMFALQSYKPGDVVVARWQRAGEPMEARVTLEGRAEN